MYYNFLKISTFFRKSAGLTQKNTTLTAILTKTREKWFKCTVLTTYTGIQGYSDVLLLPLAKWHHMILLIP